MLTVVDRDAQAGRWDHPDQGMSGPTDDRPDEVEASFVRGDDDAMRRLYDRYGSMVFGLCVRSLPADQAQDVTQEVFLSAWRSRDRYDPARGRIGAWLMRIARNRVVDQVRREGRHEQRRSGAQADHLPSEDVIEQTSVQMLVADALRELPERPRRMIALAYFQDLTHPQIAEETGTPLGTVKSDIRRGLARIRSALEVKHDG